MTVDDETPLTEQELSQLERLEQLHMSADVFQTTVGGGKLYGFLHEHSRPALADVASIMRGDIEPPEMELDDWLVKGELHWVFADSEAGKTWLALHLSTLVMQRGGIVVYFDEELGAKVIAERLVALGTSPDLVESNFVYSPFPGWHMDPESQLTHSELMETSRPQLVVYDTVTDALAEADLDENSGKEVTAWVKAFPEQARKVGAAQLVLDHVGLTAKNRAVGSRAKRAKAKVAYKLAKNGTGPKFTSRQHGSVAVSLDKNTRGADIPEKRTFSIGGSPFLWDETSSTRGVIDILTADRIRGDMRLAIGEEPGITKGALLKAVTGANETKDSAFKQLVERGEVRTESGTRNSILCFLTS